MRAKQGSKQKGQKRRKRLCNESERVFPRLSHLQQHVVSRWQEWECSTVSVSLLLSVSHVCLRFSSPAQDHKWTKGQRRLLKRKTPSDCFLLLFPSQDPLRLFFCSEIPISGETAGTAMPSQFSASRCTISCFLFPYLGGSWVIFFK